MSSKRHLLRSSITVGVFSLLSSLTGIILEMSIAAKLGLSRSSDVFYVAFTAPYVITTLLSATGQFSLVPFFSSLDSGKDEKSMWLGFSYALNLVVLGLAALAVVGAAAAPWIVRIIAPGFTGAQSQVAGSLARWLFFVIVPAGAAEIFRSFLYSHHHFAVPASSGFFRNVAVIFFILVTFRWYGDYSIVIGYFAGYGLQLLLLGGQLFFLFPVRYTLHLRGAGTNFQKLRHTGSAQLGAAVGWQGVVVAERIIASFLPPGSITALNYGLKIMATLSEVLAGSVGTGALPVISRAEARGAVDESQKLFRDAIKISTVLVAPALVFCLMLSHPIMRLVFEHGLFDANAAGRMASLFFYYSLSLPLYSAMKLIIFYLFARRESQNFLKLSLFNYAVTVAFDLLFVGVLHTGAKGIPLGLLTSLGVTLLLAYQHDLASLRRILNQAFAVFVAKIAAAAALTTFVTAVLERNIVGGATTPQVFVFLTVVCTAGCAVFLGTLILTKALSISQIVSLGKAAELS